MRVPVLETDRLWIREFVLDDIAVMRKLGTRIERNPSRDPAWLQLVGILPHPPAD